MYVQTNEGSEETIVNGCPTRSSDLAIGSSDVPEIRAPRSQRLAHDARWSGVELFDGAARPRTQRVRLESETR
jgi:hypothetical protein